MDRTLKLLLVEDNPADARLVEKLLKGSAGPQYEIVRVDRLSLALDVLALGGIDAVVLDLSLPDARGLDTFRLLHARYQMAPIVVLTGLDDERTALEAVQAGAQDYLVKGEFNENLLGRAICYAVERQRAEKRISQLNADLEKRVVELASANRELDALTRTLTLARDQALQASAYKSEFVARMSHEIRTPISAVIGTIELLRDTPLTAEQEDLLHIISESAQCLLTVINEVLDLSKLEAGRVGLDQTAFSAVALVEGTTELLVPGAAKKGIAITTFIDPRLPSELNGDPVRLRQILLNLLSNALKFTDKGEIVVRATLATSDESSVVVRFSVADTGVGVPKEAVGDLFQPFVQLHHPQSAKPPGTGLGLSISKRLVELMGGQIGVETMEGKGSTFWFSIRFKRAERGNGVELPLAAMAADLRGLRVLIADEHANARQSLRSYLQAAGLRSGCAAGAEEALEMLHHAVMTEDPYAAAIIDLSSDERSIRLARDIQSDPAISQTRLIFLTAFSQAGTGERAWKEGFSAFLTKPLKQAALIATIAEVVSPQLELEERGSEASFCAAPPLESSLRTVLLAEDNQFLQQITGKLLVRLGCAVEPAVTGSEAVQKCLSGNYSLILMDCQMPELDGYEATRRIRQAEIGIGRHTPIVAMTASTMPEDKERCLESGMDDFLGKPATMERLKEILTTWCAVQKP